MSTLNRIHVIGLAAAAAAALVALSACDSKPNTVAAPTPSTASPAPSGAPADQPGADDTANQSVGDTGGQTGGGSGSGSGSGSGGGSGSGSSGGSGSGGQSWPSPEDCVSYNPNNLVVKYVSGAFTVSDGTKVVAKVYGGSGDLAGQQALALAQRYARHCYLGRNNHRTEDREQYIFDYWRDPSGKTTTIPELEDLCSNYNRNNLTVEDMGDGYGWRVKDHDHVLHLFDNESDARNGKLVLAKYNQICSIGDNDGYDAVNFML